MNGAIFARPPRPIPKDARSVWVKSAVDGAPPAEPRALVALVAEVVDAPAGTGARSWVRRTATRLGVASVIAGRASAASWARRARSAPATGRGLVAEQVLEALPALLEPDERQAELGDRVADDVVRPVVGERDQDGPAVARPAAARARSTSAAASAASPSSTSTARTPGPLGEASPSGAARRSRPASIATRKSQTRSISPSRWLATIDRDPELGAGPPDEREHLVAAGRVEAVGRLVEQQQPRVVDERLGELDPLLHAGRVAADRAVALLVQPDVAEDLGGPLAGGRCAAGPTSGPCGVTKSVADVSGGRQSCSGM